MQERATLLGGKFSIDSMPGKGTQVRITIPCNEKIVEEVFEDDSIVAGG
jgi:nitrate/nitrite-specific signal transduction histidine kinase